MNESRTRFLLLAAASLAAADLVTKWWIFREFPIGVERPVIEGFFSLCPMRNDKLPWSLGKGYEAALRFVLPLLSVAACVLIYRYLRQADTRDRVRCIGFALILAGAAGNFWDRSATALDATYGGVRDFLLFHRVWFGKTFPAFNLADTWITVGVALVAWRILFEWHPPEERGAPAPEAAADPPVGILP